MLLLRVVLLLPFASFKRGALLYAQDVKDQLEHHQLEHFRGFIKRGSAQSGNHHTRHPASRRTLPQTEPRSQLQRSEAEQKGKDPLAPPELIRSREMCRSSFGVNLG